MKFPVILSIVLLAFAPGMASACTLKNAQDNFSLLNDVFLVYTRQIDEYSKHGEKAPDSLVAKHRELITVSASIRKLFAREIEKNSHMKLADDVDPLICQRYLALIEKHKSSVPVKTALAKKEKPKVCRSENMGKRFGDATRKMRQLTIAGKISRKEQIDFLNIAREIRDNTKSDFVKACKAIYQYEDKLQAVDKAE